MKNYLELLGDRREKSLLVDIESRHAQKYNSFKEFLGHYHKSVGLIAEMEEIYYGGALFSMASVKEKYRKLAESVRNLVQALNTLSDGKYFRLLLVFYRLDKEIQRILNPKAGFTSKDFVLPLESLSEEDTRFVGAKAATLALLHKTGEMPVPFGFVVTANAFRLFLEHNNLTGHFDEVFSRLTMDSPEEIESRSTELIRLVDEAEVPPSLADEIMRAYEDLEAKTRKDVRVAMRSSALGEDAFASFAGQYTTVLNVDKKGLLHAYKKVLAGKYSAGSILYRLHHGLDDWDAAMCVIGHEMVGSLASGIIHTTCLFSPGTAFIGIYSMLGLGGCLLSGGCSPDIYLVTKDSSTVTNRQISRKTHRLISLPSSGTSIEPVPEEMQEVPSIEDATVLKLAQYGLKLEACFQQPQAAEWAIDKDGRIFLLQARPLEAPRTAVEEAGAPVTFPDNAVLLSAGVGVSPGIAVGTVFTAGRENLIDVPDGTILVASTALPSYAKLMGRLKGIITDTGSAACHLALIAREFGVPAIMGAKNASTVLANGGTVTMVADTATVYGGIVPELALSAKPKRRYLFESTVHRRMRTFLDRITPVQISYPQDPTASADCCDTMSDLIRYSYESFTREMFRLAELPEKGVQAAHLTTNIPIDLHLIDLGGGLEPGLTVSDLVTQDHIESIPMKAFWNGFTHPGINWSRPSDRDADDLVALYATDAVSQAQKEILGSFNYAFLSRDYLNFGARFGSHLVSVIALCAEEVSQNYIALQFSGGAGTYYGRSLRTGFIAGVLEHLGFYLKVTGDLLEATMAGGDVNSMENALDQLGRLLASSRLLDISIADKEDVSRLTSLFFDGEYDFTNQSRDSKLPGFYTHTGDWKRVVEGEKSCILQDGSKWGRNLSSGLAGVMGRMMGAKYQTLLDNLEAYYHFPLAIVRNSEISEGIVRVRICPVSGKIDQAGGIAFGIRNVGNYFALRINALEDNVILFEFINDRRFQRFEVGKKFESDRCYGLMVRIDQDKVTAYLEGEELFEYRAERSMKGFVGLWTKADSVTRFEDFTIEPSEFG